MVDKIKTIVVDLIEKLGVGGATVDVSNDHNVCKVSIESGDEYALVGRDNEKFEAFSHLLKRILAKNLGEETRVIIDVNNMRAKSDEALKTKASIIADRARAFKKDFEMDPMTSYERMIIHSFLEGAPNVKTESVGEGRSRRLIIKYIEES
ncbi:MAG TPA: R3H domain-containing nucleic acid-binding protein [Candidatus Paceibacterota bacterium]